LRVRRTIVLFADYLVDLVEWDAEGSAVHEVALPWHGVDLVNETDKPLGRTAHSIAGGETREDGFGFLSEAALVHATDDVQRVLGRFAGHELRGWVLADPGTSWWSARAPDVPGKQGLAPLVLARRSAHSGRYISVWSWRDAIASVEPDGEFVRVGRRDGKQTRDLATLLGGLQRRSEETAISHQASAISELATSALPAKFVLHEPHYRRSEESWSEAGRPTATVTIATTRPDTLTVSVDVSHVHCCFVDVDAENPLDNEPAAINGAGVQLYVVAGERKGGWVLVPVPASRDVGVRAIEGWDQGLSVSAAWKPTESGYALVADVPLPADATEVALDIIVNETAPERERRRGHLVLSGARGEFIYLRGDRHDGTRLIRVNLANA
jgi:hypothetical protein